MSKEQKLTCKEENILLPFMIMQKFKNLIQKLILKLKLI